MVDLKGAVTKPNVYQISSDERLVDLIKEAGGFTDQADQKSINLSAKLRMLKNTYIFQKMRMLNSFFNFVI